MKSYLFLTFMLPILAIASPCVSSLENILSHVEKEIQIFDGEIYGLIRIMELVDSELHFAIYQELCDYHRRD